MFTSHPQLCLKNIFQTGIKKPNIYQLLLIVHCYDAEIQISIIISNPRIPFLSKVSFLVISQFLTIYMMQRVIVGKKIGYPYMQQSKYITFVFFNMKSVDFHLLQCHPQ